MASKKVKETWFINSVPGFPVYVLSDGDVMLPFNKKGTTSHFWFTMTEMLQGVKQETDTYKQVSQMFKIAMAEILEAKRKHIN